MAKTVSLKLKSRENLVSFLKRFLSIEKFILVEITQPYLICKCSTGDRSTVKYSKMGMDNVLEGTVPQEIRLPIADASKVANILKKFGPADEIFLDIQVEEGDEFLVGVQVTFRSDKLKIKMLAGDILLSRFIAPNVLKTIIKAGTDSKQIELPFKSEYFGEISSLLDIDIAKDKLKLRIDTAGRFTASGSNFEAELDTVSAPSEDVEFQFKAVQFVQVDPEISSFEIGPNFVVIRSKETDTITVMSNIEE